MKTFHNINEEREEDNAWVSAASWCHGPLFACRSSAADRHEPTRIGKRSADNHDDDTLRRRGLHIATATGRKRSMRDCAIRYRSHACYLKWPTTVAVGQSGYLRANSNTVTHPDHTIARNRNVRAI
jgi:hypothetical protein